MNDKPSAEHAVLETTTYNRSIKEDVLHQAEPIAHTGTSDESREKDGVVTPAVVTEKETADAHHEVVDDDGAHYVHGAARIALVFGLCVTTFLVGLDNLIIATAIPKITSLFHSLADVGWYGYVF